MTKVVILGQIPEEEKPKKKIEFVKYLDNNLNICSASKEVDHWENIELIAKNYNEYDLMFAYNSDRNYGTLYLGYFNDGVV